MSPPPSWDPRTAGSTAAPSSASQGQTSRCWVSPGNGWADTGALWTTLWPGSPCAGTSRSRGPVSAAAAPLGFTLSHCPHLHGLAWVAPVTRTAVSGSHSILTVIECNPPIPSRSEPKAASSRRSPESRAQSPGRQGQPTLDEHLLSTSPSFQPAQFSQSFSE